MTAYNLSGAGVQALSSSVTRLIVEVTALGTGYSIGQANPSNFFHIGLLRLGRAGAYYPPFPLDAVTQCVDVASGIDSLGYHCLAGTTIRVTEIF